MKSFKQLREQTEAPSEPLNELTVFTDPPQVLVLRRKAIRVFPGNQRVATYRNDNLDLEVAIPYNPETLGKHKISTVGTAVAESLDEDTSDNLFGMYLKHSQAPTALHDRTFKPVKHIEHAVGKRYGQTALTHFKAAARHYMDGNTETANHHFAKFKRHAAELGEETLTEAVAYKNGEKVKVHGHELYPDATGEVRGHDNGHHKVKLDNHDGVETWVHKSQLTPLKESLNESADENKPIAHHTTANLDKWELHATEPNQYSGHVTHMIKLTHRDGKALATKSIWKSGQPHYIKKHWDKIINESISVDEPKSKFAAFRSKIKHPAVIHGPKKHAISKPMKALLTGEETIMEASIHSLHQINRTKTPAMVKFGNGSAAMVHHETAARIMKLHSMMKKANKRKIENLVNASPDGLKKVIEFAQVHMK